MGIKLKLLTLTVLFSLWSNLSIAQNKYDYIWTFGYIGPPDNIQNFVLDFNGQESRFYKVPLQINSSTVNSSICDKDGNLLLITNGCIINNKEFNLVENGDGLNPGFILQGNWCDNGYPGGNQSHIFLPDPYDEKIIWLFHNSYSLSINYPLPQYLRYTKIDLNYNNGLGKVIDKNKILVNDSLITFGEISAVKHANNKDWWILSPTGRPDTLFRTFLLNQNGITGPFEQHVGKQISNQYSGAGGFKFNAQGTKIARFGDGQGVYLYDFDRTTGKLSNFIAIDTPSYSTMGGIEFSPSGKYLYVSTWGELFQYDMEAKDIKSSIIRIDSFDGFHTWTWVTYGCLQLGPDCRIYVLPTTGVEYQGIIMNPDLPGKLCDFRPHSLKLPAYGRLNRVYHPHYRLGTGDPDCDPSIRLNTAAQNIPKELPYMNVYPNPSDQILHVSLRYNLTKDARADIVDLYGRSVYTEILKQGADQFELNISNVNNGIYLLRLKDEDGRIAEEKIVVGR